MFTVSYEGLNDAISSKCDFALVVSEHSQKAASVIFNKISAVLIGPNILV